MSKEPTEVELLFSKLYTNYNYMKVRVNEDSLVYYGIPLGYNSKITKDLNSKIAELKLPLVAKSNSRNGLFQDTITVRNN